MTLLRRLLAALVVGAAFVAAPALASAQNVPVKLAGNWCYAGGLARAKVVVSGMNGNSYSNTFSISGSSGTLYGIPQGNHRFQAQAWCGWGGVLAGRSGSMCQWVYGSGWQPTVTIWSSYYAC